MNQEHQDRRRRPRIGLNCPVVIQVNDIRFIGEANDLSRDGMSIQTQLKLEGVSSLVSQFTLPQFGQIQIVGLVVHQTPVNGLHLVGVRFLDLPLSVERLIEAFIDEQLGREHGA